MFILGLFSSVTLLCQIARSSWIAPFCPFVSLLPNFCFCLAFWLLTWSGLEIKLSHLPEVSNFGEGWVQKSDGSPLASKIMSDDTIYWGNPVGQRMTWSPRFDYGFRMVSWIQFLASYTWLLIHRGGFWENNPIISKLGSSLIVLWHRLVTPLYTCKQMAAIPPKVCFCTVRLPRYNLYACQLHQLWNSIWLHKLLTYPIKICKF